MIFSLTAQSLLATLALTAGASDQVQVTARPDAGHVPMAAAPDETQAPTPATRLTTDEQIAAWIAAAPRAEAPSGLARQDFGDTAYAPPPAEEPERRIRGSVSAAVGSHGYRGGSVSLSAPVGEDGWVAFNYSQSEGGPASIYGYDPYGYGRRHDVERFGPPGLYGPGGLLEADPTARWLNLDPAYGW